MSQAQTASAGQAAGSSFYAGMRILPQAQRKAMFAVYAFCRVVDDIADGAESAPARAAALAAWREGIEALYRGETRPETSGLAEPMARYGLRKADFLAVIDGMLMDADTRVRIPDGATLDLYCDRVASAVGRLSVRIFGMEDAPGVALAHHLGRALQLTNILRDIDEDAGIDRVYLPADALAAAGVTAADARAVAADPRIVPVCRALAGQAAAHFAEARRIMDGAPRALVRAPRLMSAAYGRVLERMTAQGWAPPRTRIGVDKLRLLLAVFRYGLF